MLEEPRLGLLERFGPASFHHVREQRPRCAAEPNERDLACKPVPRSCDSRKDIAELLVHVDVLAQARDIRGRVERSGERRCRVHEDLHPHGLRDHEDVTEDYGGVEQARIPPDRLERDFARERWRAADIKKLVLRADRAELYRDEYEPVRERKECCHMPGRYRPAWRITQTGARSVSSPEERYEIGKVKRKGFRRDEPLAARRMRSFFKMGNFLLRGTFGFQSGDSTMMVDGRTTVGTRTRICQDVAAALEAGTRQNMQKKKPRTLVTLFRDFQGNYYIASAYDNIPRTGKSPESRLGMRFASVIICNIFVRVYLESQLTELDQSVNQSP
jgi:hypothetical protein